jgi:hypothetical protein
MLVDLRASKGLASLSLTFLVPLLAPAVAGLALCVKKKKM